MVSIVFRAELTAVDQPAAVSFAKREPRPRALGGVSGTLMYGFLARLLEGSVWETQGRARGSSRNVRHEPHRTHVPGSQRCFLLTGHHAQAPAVLDHSRTLPAAASPPPAASTWHLPRGSSDLPIK